MRVLVELVMAGPEQVVGTIHAVEDEWGQVTYEANFRGQVVSDYGSREEARSIFERAMEKQERVADDP